LIDGFKERFENAIGRVNDYYCNKHQSLRFAPSRLFSCDELNVDLLQRVFSDPLAFDPREEAPAGAFLWPWQRSIRARATLKGSVEAYYQSIGTTSLVLDIRGSTTAMDLSTDAAAYAQLIDDIVEQSQKIIVRYDGFFDKETGDGVVGHFCHSTAADMRGQQFDPQKQHGVIEMALRAAIEISRAVGELCSAYQSWLIHGMDGLGPAIGIHSGSSVWLADATQIRAIGPPVVGASRLCARAEAREIILSNRAYVEYTRGVPAGELLDFEKQSIEIKEYRERLGLYGYVMRQQHATS
jgi:class 3 adenylate cyclase